MEQHQQHLSERALTCATISKLEHPKI